MNLDDRARQAGIAASTRARQIAPHPSGLERKPWVAPAGIVGAAALIVLVAVAINTFASDRSGKVETVAGPDATTVVAVDAVSGPILAGFVSASGEISVLVGDAGSATLVQLEASAGAPVVGVETIPDPRWLFDGRVIEYVTEIDGELHVVRVDVRTGRTSTEPYRVVLIGGGFSTSLEDEGPLTGRILLMAGASGPSVRAVEDETGAQWELLPSSSDRTLLLDIDSTRFLAPTADGLIVVADGVLGTINGDGEVAQLELDGITAETLSVVAAGPGSELAFGLRNGSVVVMTPETIEPFDLGGGVDAVTGLSWAPSGETFIAMTADREQTSLHVCAATSTNCNRIELVGAAGGRLVRGIPSPPQGDMFFGFWPENTQDKADAAVDAEDAAPWRFDPELLVAEFAEVVLGWSGPSVAPPMFPMFPYWASFEVRPSTEQAPVTISAAQLAGDSGWVITNVSAPNLRLNSAFSTGGSVRIGFDRQGAAAVEVIVKIGDTEYSETTEDLDELEFDIDSPLGSVASYLILFKDDDGRVLAASSGDLNRAPIARGTTG